MSRRDEPRSWWRRCLTVLILVITVGVCLGMIVSGYCGYISPMKLRLAPLAVMTFPGWLLGAVVMLVIDLIWWRRISLIVIVSLLVCLPQIRDFSPFHLPHFGKMSEEDESRALTLMSYNVFNFNDQETDTASYNRQLSYIIDKHTDIVCIEEAANLAPTKTNKITQEQLQKLNDIYPYIYISGEAFAFLSKYEAEPIPIDFPSKDFESGDINAWRVYVRGEVINVFVVHLRSFALSIDDRDLFREITSNVDNISRQDIHEVRRDLVPKIISASQERVAQFKLLASYLKKYGGENAIVCGDFNDPVCCWGLNMLEEQCNMKQLYSEVGFGPMITYNANNFFFRIDHILYRGQLTPYSMKRGSTKASDHYPIIATFLLPSQK